MTDLVERLRNYIPGENTEWVSVRLKEAADEIELLLDRVELLEDIRDTANSITDFMITEPGGDKMVYEGSMNPVETLRSLEAEYVSFLWDHNLLEKE